MGRMAAVLALVAALAVPPAASAHEKGGRTLGVVESVTAERLVVKATDGHLVTYAITPETRFFRGEKPARAEDVRAGQRAVVQGKPVGEGLEAVRVKLAPPARK